MYSEQANGFFCPPKTGICADFLYTVHMSYEAYREANLCRWAGGDGRGGGGAGGGGAALPKPTNILINR
jgi:hypothetical protein